MDFVPYPQRPGEPDCSYYIRTGMCRFGATCRFNHPPDRTMIIANARMKGEFPERIGQPECQYYLKTGTCKFGATCKFHHPRDKACIDGRVPLNILGYPIRANENECAYYLRTGECKFGSTCKFNHPRPSNMMVSVSGSPVYPSMNSPTNPPAQTYPGGVINWPMTRTSFVPSPPWQGASSYAPLILPPGIVSIPEWNAYGSGFKLIDKQCHVLYHSELLQSQIGSMSLTEGHHQAIGHNQIYETSHQSEVSNPASQRVHSQYRGGAVPMGMYALPRDNTFPERPGQPECQYYMKTGDCKFGAVCRFHHPKERLIPAPDCKLSSLGLPLRQGEPLCVFYSRYGICKFGPSCKFDHPMCIFGYDLSTSS
ncbi:unnamed protein product [Rhodiola kirilowii]